jgi:uracil-DNA glycosylase
LKHGRDLQALLAEVRACRRCEADLPLGPRPVLQASLTARILIAGQAPGKRVHASGIPFDDASGERLRAWMGIDRETFYDAGLIAILPMGFCYPGSGKAGDLAPRAECAAAWRAALLRQLGRLELTLVLGRYAQEYHCGGKSRAVTERVSAWRETWPCVVPLPHPSPRNNRWLKQNPWFEAGLLPELRARISSILGDRSG